MRYGRTRCDPRKPRVGVVPSLASLTYKAKDTVLCAPGIYHGVAWGPAAFPNTSFYKGRCKDIHNWSMS